MRKLIALIFLIICHPQATQSQTFTDKVLANTVRISKEIYVEHQNDPLTDPQGTGFIVSFNNGNDYIVTARHVADHLDTPEILIDYNGKDTINVLRVPTKGIVKHPSKDIAIIPLPRLKSTLSSLDLDLSETFGFGDYGVSIGFPLGTSEARMRGGMISYNIFKKAKGTLEEIFFDARIHNGESGSPVFIPAKQTIIGIVSNIEVDKGIVNLVPIEFIKDLVDQK